MTDDKKTNTGAIWGAGYQAGYSDCLAGKPNGGNMNQKKIDKMLREQTIIARKVYDCVPILEEWTKTKIHQEVHRTGTNQNGKVVDGCLNSLKDTGLIKEVGKGKFIRVTASTPSPVKEIDYDQPVSAPVSPKTTTVFEDKTPGRVMRDPVEIIEDLNVKISKLKHDMAELQEEFENAALEISEYVENSKEQVEQMQQLQEILNKIGIGK